jgi:hypothetical protein
LIEIRDLEDTPSQEELQASLTKLQQDRDIWIDERQRGSWVDSPAVDAPRGGVLSQLLGFRNPQARKKGL